MTNSGGNEGHDGDAMVLTETAEGPLLAKLLWGIAAFLVAVGLMVAGSMLSADESGPVLSISLVTVLAGLVVGVAARKRWIRTFRWCPAELVLSIWPIPLGLPVEATYIRRLRRSVVPPDPVLLIGSLQCLESIVYSQDLGEQCHAIETVHDIPIEVISLATNDTSLAGALTISVPYGASPSFDLEHNVVEWQLSVRAVGESGVDVSSFDLWVQR